MARGGGHEGMGGGGESWERVYFCIVFSMFH